MNVLVIPEDFRVDQYILLPIISAMMAELGKPKAKVRVCRDPLLGGVEQALDRDRIREVIDRYRGMVDLYLLCVDRDGKPGRRMALDGIEVFAREECGLGPGRVLLAENAWQELEVWVLAGHDLPKDWDWGEVRREIHPKEAYFQPIAEGRKLTEEPGGGRKTLAEEAARRYGRIRQLCPEDVAQLEIRIRGWIGSSP